MRREQVVPPVMVHHLAGFAGQRHIDRLADRLGGLGAELHDAEIAEIGAVDQPEPAVGAHHQAGIDAIAVLIAVRAADVHRLAVGEIRRSGIEGLVPHGIDPGMIAEIVGAVAGGIHHKVAVTDLDRIGRDTATGADGTVMPGPSVLGDEAAAAGSERIIFAVAFDDGGRVMDIGTPRLGEGRDGKKQGRQGGKCILLHITSSFWGVRRRAYNPSRGVRFRPRNAGRRWPSPGR